MTDSGARPPIASTHSPIATPGQVASEPVPFPSKTAAAPIESFFPDWRRRLVRNLSRRNDSRWDPLTWVHAVEEAPAHEVSNVVTSVR